MENKMIKELIKLANHLDSRGFAKEADYLDLLAKRANTEEEDRVISLEFDDDTGTIPRSRGTNAEGESRVISLEFDDDTGVIDRAGLGRCRSGDEDDDGRDLSLDPRHRRGGGAAKEHLYKIEEYAGKLRNMIRDDDNLSPQVENKIAIIANEIGEIKHHLEYKISELDSGENVEEDDEATIELEPEIIFAKKEEDGENK
jgi:hypothetical protein